MKQASLSYLLAISVGFLIFLIPAAALAQSEASQSESSPSFPPLSSTPTPPSSALPSIAPAHESQEPFTGLVYLLGMSTPSQTCDPNQLAFSVDPGDGEFDGMSQSGTLLVLRNLGPTVCTVPARPELAFLDAERQPLPVTLRQTPGMHPGPVIPPVALPIGVEVTSEARWVSADAYDANNCVSPKFISLSLGSRSFVVPFSTHMCGPKGESPSYSVTFLRRDPRHKPSRP